MSETPQGNSKSSLSPEKTTSLVEKLHQDQVNVEISQDEKDESSDELVIDLGQNKSQNKTKSRKRIRPDMSDSSEDEHFSFPENCAEIEEKVSAAAAKNNLTAENIKKIIKRVVLNEHVLAIVKIREEEMQKEVQMPELTEHKLKLTRAKTKELQKTIPSPFAWPLPITTPVKIPKFQMKHDVESLISQDLPDEESDDEYDPAQEEPTDDERDNLESSSDIDSQPKTPVNLEVSLSAQQLLNEGVCEDSIKYTDDGIFKIPQEVDQKIVNQEEATIAWRTRSKLCLSNTPIEQIEESFEPPDVSLDDVLEADNDWRDFIYDLPNLEPSNNKDDDEADPEYNVAADFEPFDNEEYLVDNDEVEVSKKELEDLVSELLEGIDGDFNFDEPPFSFNTDIVPLVGPNTDLTPICMSSEVGVQNNPNISPMKILDIGKWRSNIEDYNPIGPDCESSTNVDKTNNASYNSSEIKVDSQPETTDKSSNDNGGSQIIEFQLKEIGSTVVGVDQYSFIIQSNQESNSKTSTTVDFQNQNNQVHINESIATQEKCVASDDKNTNGKVKKPLFELPAEYKKWIYNETDAQILPEQRLILDQQMRQHVQLITQCFLQIHGHPKFWNYGPQQKEYLMTLKYLGNDDSNSAFIPCNLLSAIELCDKWTERLAEDTPEMKKMMQFILDENERMMKKHRLRSTYYGKFTQQYVDTVLHSTVFVYPNLLPMVAFRVDKNESKEYLLSEEYLMALGLEQFYSYIIANDNIIISSENLQLERVTYLISKYMMPCRPHTKIKRHIKKLKLSSTDNPIKHFYKHKNVPETVEKLISYDPKFRPVDHPVISLPYVWQKHCRSFTKKTPLKIKRANKKSLATPDVTSIAEPSTEFSPQSLPSLLPSPPSPNCEPFECVQTKTKTSTPTKLNFVRESSECNCVRILCHLHADTGIQKPNQTIITDYFNKSDLPSLISKFKDDFQPSSDSISTSVRITIRLRHLLGLCRITVAPDPHPHTVKSKFLHVIEYISSEMLPSMPFLSTNSKDCTDAVKQSSHAEPVTDLNPKDNAASKTVSEEKTSSNCRNNGKTNVPVNSARQRLAAKARRELEANKAMFLKDASAEDIRETMYAAAFFDKVKLRLNCHSADCDAVSKFENFQSTLNDFDPQSESPCDLYRKLDTLFGAENVDLTEEFLTFLTPGQATEIGRFMDYFMLTCMLDFIERLQILFVNKPARLRKIFWCLERLVEKPEAELTMESVKNAILPLLKGNQYLIDWFLKLFPEEKPPESLTSNGYEVIDVEKMILDDTEDHTNIESTHEVLNIPHINENYGNDRCTCKCHNSANEKYKNRNRHCLACGTKYIQGRMFVQHGRGLRPVHLDWNENANGQHNQIHRLSASAQPSQANSRKRATSLENLPTTTKTDSDDERVSPKRNAKCLRTPTSKAKKPIHLTKITTKMNENEVSPIRNKPACSKSLVRDGENLKPEEEYSKSSASLENHEYLNAEDHFETFDEFTKYKKEIVEQSSARSNKVEVIYVDNDASSATMQIVVDPPSTTIKSELIDVDMEEEEDCPEYCDNRKLLSVKSEMDANWTREEDKVILVLLRTETKHDLTLNRIKELLPHRSLDEIQKRFQNLLNLLQKIASAT